MCIACLVCVDVCPATAVGFAAAFSPVVTPRRGPCEPSCNFCGAVCPTGAIAPLPVAEKLKARIGTARIVRQKCLVWELEKKCLICEEVCPFDAIEFKKRPGNPIALPFVNESKCAGCGFCEHYCPVRATPAIIVAPMLALRLSEGSYGAAALEKGYSLELERKTNGGVSCYHGQGETHSMQMDQHGLPPGFTKCPFKCFNLTNVRTYGAMASSPFHASPKRRSHEDDPRPFAVGPPVGHPIYGQWDCLLYLCA